MIGDPRIFFSKRIMIYKLYKYTTSMTRVNNQEDDHIATHKQ